MDQRLKTQPLASSLDPWGESMSVWFLCVEGTFFVVLKGKPEAKNTKVGGPHFKTHPFGTRIDASHNQTRFEWMKEQSTGYKGKKGTRWCE